jgi:quercetin dioxygenase-like cupin family protein
LHQIIHRPLRLAVAVVVLTLALLATLIALPRDRATATPPSGIAAELLGRGTVARASHVRVAGIKLATRGPVDVATVRVTFQPGGSTGWHIHPGPALATVKTGQLTLHRAKRCRRRTFSAGQTFLEFGPNDVNLTRNETGSVTETVVTFVLPVGAPITVMHPPLSVRCSRAERRGPESHSGPRADPTTRTLATRWPPPPPPWRREPAPPVAFQRRLGSDASAPGDAHDLDLQVSPG